VALHQRGATAALAVAVVAQVLAEPPLMSSFGLISFVWTVVPALVTVWFYR
jgi:hypothetical protein